MGRLKFHRDVACGLTCDSDTSPLDPQTSPTCQAPIRISPGYPIHSCSRRKSRDAPLQFRVAEIAQCPPDCLLYRSHTGASA